MYILTKIMAETIEVDCGIFKYEIDSDRLLVHSYSVYHGAVTIRDDSNKLFRLYDINSKVIKTVDCVEFLKELKNGNIFTFQGKLVILSEFAYSLIELLEFRGIHQREFNFEQYRAHNILKCAVDKNGLIVTYFTHKEEKRNLIEHRIMPTYCNEFCVGCVLEEILLYYRGLTYLLQEEDNKIYLPVHTFVDQMSTNLALCYEITNLGKFKSLIAKKQLLRDN